MIEQGAEKMEMSPGHCIGPWKCPAEDRETKTQLKRVRCARGRGARAPKKKAEQQMAKVTGKHQGGKRRRGA